jgi:hypothetical protein
MSDAIQTRTCISVSSSNNTDIPAKCQDEVLRAVAEILVSRAIPATWGLGTPVQSDHFQQYMKAGLGEFALTLPLDHSHLRGGPNSLGLETAFVRDARVLAQCDRWHRLGVRAASILPSAVCNTEVRQVPHRLRHGIWSLPVTDMFPIEAGIMARLIDVLQSGTRSTARAKTWVHFHIDIDKLAWRSAKHLKRLEIAVGSLQLRSARAEIILSNLGQARVALGDLYLGKPVRSILRAA